MVNVATTTSVGSVKVAKGGYTTLAQELYYGNFNYDFFTGVSLGFSTIYKDYTLDIAIKNLGSIGVIHSLSISKSINQI